jgi:cell division protein FtsZ
MSAPAGAPMEPVSMPPAAAYAMSRPREEREVMAPQAAPAMAQAMQNQPLQAAVGHSYPAPRMTAPQAAPAMRLDPAPRAPSFDTRPAPRVESRPLPPASELPFAPASEPAAAEQPRPEPAPVEPPRFEAPRFEQAPASEPAPQPAAEASAPAAEKKRGPNIFTRAANRALDLARQTSSDLRDATPSSMMTRMAKPEPVIRSSAPAPQPAPPAPAVQTRLALDPTDRIAARPSEEEMLDIPAFLRRQAN